MFFLIIFNSVDESILAIVTSEIHHLRMHLNLSASYSHLLFKLIYNFHSRMEKVCLNLLDVGGKVRSKSELYKLLTVEGHFYLPKYKFCNVEFMAHIIEGKRKVAALPYALLYSLF